MLKTFMTTAVLALGATSASAVSIGFDITLGGAGNTPQFALYNTSASGATLDSFSLTIGDTTRAFDFIQPTREQQQAAEAANGTAGSYLLVAPEGGTVTIIEGDRRSDENRYERLEVGFTSFDMGDIFEFIVDIDFASQDAWVHFRNTLFNNSGANSVLTAVFSDGSDLTFELPDVDTYLDFYSYQLSAGPTTLQQTSIPPAPLPAGLPLLVGGLGAFAWFRRRKG